MPQDAPAIQNKGMLIAAVIVASIVVVIYNVHIARVRKESSPTMVSLLRFTNDMPAGREVTPRDYEVVQVSATFEAGLPKVVAEKDETLLQNARLNMFVRKGDWVEWRHILPESGDVPSTAISQGMVSHTIEVDKNTAPGDMLRIGDRVNLIGVLSLSGRPARAYRIIRGVKVLGIGGRNVEAGVSTGRKRVQNAYLRSYRKITIEAPEDVSLQLTNILSRTGPVKVEVMNPRDRPPRRPKIDSKELAELTAAN